VDFNKFHATILDDHDSLFGKYIPIENENFKSDTNHILNLSASALKFPIPL